MSKNEVDLVWAKFELVVRNNELTSDIAKRWEQWKGVTWQTRHVAEKQKNLKARMRAL